MENKLIDNIKIEKYKCFDDFSAGGLKRINLIGGINNAGKTAFIEACYLVATAKNIKNFLFSLTSIEKERDRLNFSVSDEINIIDILTTNKFISIDSLNHIKLKVKEESYATTLDINLNSKLFHIDFNPLISFTASEKAIFISNFGFSNNQLKDVYKAVQFKDKDKGLDSFLEKFNFVNPKFKIIDGKPYLKIDDSDEYNQLNKYGDGIKHYISIICSLYACSGGYLFLDEIESGLHHTLYDDLWRIIFEVSKQENVQIFATTHSKECIESYNKITTEMKNTDSVYFEIAQNKKTKKRFIRNLESGQLNYELTHQGRYRGE